MSNLDITKLRHSAAHLLAMAVSSLYKEAKLGNCGVTDTGFYYDIEFDEPLSADDLQPIQTKFQELVQANIAITSQAKPVTETENYFAQLEQPYKRELLSEYKSKRVDLVVFGENQFVDMCVAAMAPSTAHLEHMMLTDVSGAYWKGDDKRPMLSRISGVVFSAAEELIHYQEFQAEVERRDHRNLGKKLNFFTTDTDLGSGFVFLQPKGMFVKEVIVTMIKRRFSELRADFVESPLLSLAEKLDTVQQPVNEQFIAKNQYAEDDKWYALRQQTLPYHLEFFNARDRSYRDLPWRVAEIGKQMRYEKNDEIEGLHTLREFTQDTLTVVATRDQLEREVESIVSQQLSFLKDLGFSTIDIELNIPVADTKAHRQDALFISGIIKGTARKLSISVQENTASTEIDEPELVFSIKDSLKQRKTLGKTQIMLATPFEKQLSFVGKDGEYHVPALIRTTLVGSVERLLAALIEHYAGLLPLWLSLEQVRVLPVTSKQELYADKLKKQLQESGIRATLDADAEPLDGKIKQAEEDKVPYMLIVGEKEQSTSTVSVRIQGRGDIGLLAIEAFIQEIIREIAAKSIKTMLV